MVFDGRPDIGLALTSLDPQIGKVHPELRNVQRLMIEDEVIERATVFIPDGTLGRFLRHIEEYVATSAEDQPRKRKLVDPIMQIGLASIQQLWTEPELPFPPVQKLAWWEVWLRRRDGALRRLRAYADASGVRVDATALGFAEHVVVHVQARAEQLAAALDVLDDLAELRRPREPVSLLAADTAMEQAEWIEQLAGRTRATGDGAPAVCVMDTGVAREHPLLQGSLPDGDCHTFDPSWGVHDAHGHGTEMAGLALYGDLGTVMVSSDEIHLSHRLESVKLLPGPGHANDPELYGAVTAIGASLVEIEAPRRPRVFALATTAAWASEPHEAAPIMGIGQPSSWSSAIDALAAGLGVADTPDGMVLFDEEGDRARRLFVVSAGNVREGYDQDHLSRSDVSPVEDPAQAWNAVTVGAFTELDSLVGAAPGFEGYQPLATFGELSPFSRTSLVYERKGPGRDALWPIKPDILLEGGNLACSAEGALYDTPDGLQLLTTLRPGPSGRLLTTTHGTSPATAQAAHLAAKVMAEYPALWPETVRALLVHAAEWTRPMATQFSAARRPQRLMLQRRYGMGVPTLARATRSATDALTLIAQDSIHPFDGNGKMREIHFHELPWPAEELQALGEAEVRMRVTLSYFIEPNPSNRGWRDRYSYASHQLRFAVREAEESTGDFEKRVNAAARDEEGQRSYNVTDSEQWMFGPKGRTAGSLHTDIWRGTAADLAARGMLAIYPVTGWWKLRQKRDRSDHGAAYALIVSIETPEQDADIWTPVAQQIGVPIEITR